MSDQGWSAEKVRRAKIHLSYISIGAIVIFTYIATKEWSSVKDLVDKINFASTISSLILAILAIVYAVWSNSSTSGSISSLITVAEKVDKASVELRSASSAITDDIKKLSQSTISLDEQVKRNNNLFEGMQKSRSNQFSSTTQKPDNSLSDNKYFFGRSSVYGLFSLMIAAKSCEYKKHVSMTEAIQGLPFDVSYMVGYAIAATAAGYFESASIFNMNSVIIVDGPSGFTYSDIRKAYEEFIERRQAEDSEHAKQMKEFLVLFENNLERIGLMAPNSDDSKI